MTQRARNTKRGSETRSKLHDAYKTAADLAETPEERKEVRKKFRDLFVAVADDSRDRKRVKNTSCIRIPLPDPLGVLTDISRGNMIRVFDPLREMISLPDEGEPGLGDGGEKRTLCKDMDFEELAENYCGSSDDTLGCMDAISGVLTEYDAGKISDNEFNLLMRDTLLEFGIDKNINFKRNIEIRSPCFATEVERICGSDIECMETIEKMVKAVDDPDQFREIMEEARRKYVR